MERHDPLSTFCPTTGPTRVETATPEKPKRQTTPSLLRSLATVADETLAALAGGNADVRQIRAAFTAFCKANVHFNHLGQAWAAFQAAAPKPAPPVATQAKVSPPPLWRQRMQRFALCHDRT
jgi:hypothetical protein